MNTPVLPRRTPEFPVVGARGAFTRTLTEGDVALFIGATWDVNPYHTDDVYVGQTSFRRRIVPGLFTASLLTHMGGLWAFLATEMHVEFLAPVYIGDTITAEALVAEVDSRTGRVLLRCRCTNTSGQDVLRAEISGFPGRFASQGETP